MLKSELNFVLKGVELGGDLGQNSVELILTGLDALNLTLVLAGLGVFIYHDLQSLLSFFQVVEAILNLLSEIICVSHRTNFLQFCIQISNTLLELSQLVLNLILRLLRWVWQHRLLQGSIIRLFV